METFEIYLALKITAKYMCRFNGLYTLLPAG